MKNIKILFLVATIAIFNACVVEDDENPFYPPGEYGVYPSYTENDIEFEVTDNPANSTVAFSIAAGESGGAKATSGELFINYDNGDFVKLSDISSFPSSHTVSLADVGSALNISAADLQATGGPVDFKTYFNTEQGETMTSTSYLSTLILCTIPVPGDYTIEMVDTYGDGWQTTDGDSGDGITITLDTGVVIEVGMCSDWAPSPYTCTPGSSAATATVTIPVGTLSAVWYFPGDYFSEIQFTIYSPAGNFIAFYDNGTEAQILRLNLCGD